MTEKYGSYLLSAEWKAKREKRLSISGHKCSACGFNKGLHVHHLTYARIFKEDMADLLPLCKFHHDAAEWLVKRGKLPRSADVLFLATETIRLLKELDDDLPKSSYAKKDKTPKTKTTMQEWLKQQDWFVQALKLERNQFKQLMRKQAKGKQRAKMMSNAFAIYDFHQHKTINRQ